MGWFSGLIDVTVCSFITYRFSYIVYLFTRLFLGFDPVMHVHILLFNYTRIDPSSGSGSSSVYDTRRSVHYWHPLQETQSIPGPVYR